MHFCIATVHIKMLQKIPQLLWSGHYFGSIKHLEGYFSFVQYKYIQYTRQFNAILVYVENQIKIEIKGNCFMRLLKIKYITI